MTDLEPIQRYVNSDNSCLFSSISYLVDKSNFNENSSIIYRMMIVDYIKDKFDVDKAKIIYINEVPIYNQFGVLSCYLKTKNDLHLTIKIITYRD